MLNKYRYFLLAFLLTTGSASYAQNFDINLLKSINQNQSSFKDNFFKAEANSVIIFNIAAPVGVFTAGLINHNPELKKDAAYMASAFVLSTVVTTATKNIVKRNRPFVDYPFIVKRDEGGSYSFPSGHTSAAFTTATSLCLLFPKWYVIVPSYLWASTVAYGRLYLGVHYPTDVLAGAVVGAGSAWLSWKVQKWMEHKKGKKK
jgi:membrane-associated phospholipid phosphatase